MTLATIDGIAQENARLLQMVTEKDSRLQVWKDPFDSSIYTGSQDLENEMKGLREIVKKHSTFCQEQDSIQDRIRDKEMEHRKEIVQLTMKLRQQEGQCVSLQKQLIVVREEQATLQVLSSLRMRASTSLLQKEHKDLEGALERTMEQNEDLRKQLDKAARYMQRKKTSMHSEITDLQSRLVKKEHQVTPP